MGIILVSMFVLVFVIFSFIRLKKWYNNWKICDLFLISFVARFLFFQLILFSLKFEKKNIIRLIRPVVNTEEFLISNTHIKTIENLFLKINHQTKNIVCSPARMKLYCMRDRTQIYIFYVYIIYILLCIFNMTYLLNVLFILGRLDLHFFNVYQHIHRKKHWMMKKRWKKHRLIEQCVYV